MHNYIAHIINQNQIKSNILLTNQGPSKGNKLNYKYTYKGERVVWLIDRHNNTIVKLYVWTYTNI